MYILRNFIYFTLLVLAACTTVPSKRISKKAKDGFIVRYTEFQPPKDLAIDRTVIVFPPTGGITFLEKSYARALAKRGASVKVIRTWSGLGEMKIDLGIHQKLHERALRAYEMVQKTCPKNHKISVFGTSLGGIYSAVTTHRYSNMDRVFVIAAGTPVPQVIGHSEHESMAGIRRKRFKKFAYSNRENYAKKIDKVFHLDPSDQPNRSKGKALGMSILLQDKAVPTRYQKNLQALWNPEKVIMINAGHFWGIVRTWWSYKNDVVEFLVPKNEIRRE